MITYGSSNVILDAILLKKPIILFKNPIIPDLSRLSDKTVISECSKIDDLDNLISKIIDHYIPDEFFENYIKKQIGNFDGKNSQRISNMILKLTQKNSL
jgi:CDP-glycerol glycerophosphotransferase (TagB/SpsB family)